MQIELPKAIFLTGLPASGKGTVLEAFLDTGLHGFDTSDLIDDEFKSSPEAYALDIQQKKEGKVLRDSLAISLLSKKMAKMRRLHPGLSFVASGFPRSPGQAYFVADEVPAEGFESVVVVLTVDPNNCIKRHRKRLAETKGKRVDDHPEIYAERLERAHKVIHGEHGVEAFFRKRMPDRILYLDGNVTQPEVALQARRLAHQLQR